MAKPPANKREDLPSYHYDPDAPTSRAWARMSRAERASWALLCLTRRLPLDPSTARSNLRQCIVMAVHDSDAPVPVRSDPEHEVGVRQVLAVGPTYDGEWALARVRMVAGERVHEIARMVADDDAGRRAEMLRPKRPEPKEETDEDGEV